MLFFKNVKVFKFVVGQCAASRTSANFLFRNVSGNVSGKKVRIGCASGFWGDTATSVPQLVYGGNLDYLVFDYLAEITMSLLTAARQKMPEMGYAPDFVHAAMAPFLNDIKDSGVKVISNAGGINPVSCASMLQSVADKKNVQLKIAVVTGDDLMPQKEIIESEIAAKHSGMPPFPNGVNSMNAYLGSRPIAEALRMGADVVITGRCVDSALALAPLVYEFDWKDNEWDKLSSGSLAGHIIECGAQSTGGNFTDWETVNGWDNMGFPIVECSDDGSFILTKAPNTGGLVSVHTAAEQMVYEIGDPKSYLLPDVTCDFSNVTITKQNENSVLLKGAKGRPPSDYYKVSATYMDGYRLTGVCPVIGPKAALKARRTAEAVLKRCQRIFGFLGLEDFRRTNIEILGTGVNYGANATLAEQETREAVMWMAVHHNQKNALELVAREIAASSTGAAPGLTTMIGGRPKPSPVLRLHSFLYPKDKVKISVFCKNETKEQKEKLHNVKQVDGSSGDVTEEQSHDLPMGNCAYKVGELAYTRSGDKGNSANIGVIARDRKYYPYLKEKLTAEAVGQYFKHLFEDDATVSQQVHRYLLPGVSGLNFVLEDALGGGGVSSLKSDPQGKALGQILADFNLDNMPDLKKQN